MNALIWNSCSVHQLSVSEPKLSFKRLYHIKHGTFFLVIPNNVTKLNATAYSMKTFKNDLFVRSLNYWGEKINKINFLDFILVFKQN